MNDEQARLIARYGEDDDLDGAPAAATIEARIAALRQASIDDGEAGMYWSAGIGALKAESWERRLTGIEEEAS